MIEKIKLKATFTIGVLCSILFFSQASGVDFDMDTLARMQENMGDVSHQNTIDDSKNPTISLEEDEEKRIELMSEDVESSLVTEKHAYETEVDRLMDIIINSLYTEKEVFLRELISNSSDALEKARFLSLSNPEILSDLPNLDIKIDIDKKNKTISIIDSGIGMTKTDLLANLGTIAKSGTTNFLEAISKGESDTNLIGQFGVGFYSSFLVADKVTVVSRNPADEQYIWISTADGSFTISKDPRGNTLKRGTQVILHLKEDAEKYLNDATLKQLSSKYSEFIEFPIYFRHVKKETIEVPDEDNEVIPGENDEEIGSEEDDSTDEKKAETNEAKTSEKEAGKKMKKIEKETKQWRQMNAQKPIWLRPKEDISKEEYGNFYSAIMRKKQDYLSHIHFIVEGDIVFKALLYIPNKSPSNMYTAFYNKGTSLKLYVRRVLVSDSFDNLLPNYLNFIAGIVDADDLPLNVSREQLQQHKLIDVISKKLVRKILDQFQKIGKESEDLYTKREQTLKELTDEEEIKLMEQELKKPTKFQTLLKEFGKNLKIGCYDDKNNRSKILKLFRFRTINHPDKAISLDQYINEMSEDHKKIYYLSGDNLDVLKKSPLLETFRSRTLDVILTTESMDEPCFTQAISYSEKKFHNIQKHKFELDNEEEKKRHSILEEKYKLLLNWWGEILGKKIGSVKVSQRLVNQPVTLVSSSYGYSSHMEKLMKAQTFMDQDGMKMMTADKVFEINPNHPAIIYMYEQHIIDPESKQLNQIANGLYYSAVITSGYDLDDPQEAGSVLNDILYNYVQITVPETIHPIHVDIPEPVDEPVEEIPSEEEEEEEEELVGKTEEKEKEEKIQEKEETIQEKEEKIQEKEEKIQEKEEKIQEKEGKIQEKEEKIQEKKEKLEEKKHDKKEEL